MGEGEVSIRHNEAILVRRYEVELESMPDAARPVDGCNIRHDRAKLVFETGSEGHVSCTPQLLELG